MLMNQVVSYKSVTSGVTQLVDCVNYAYTAIQGMETRDSDSIYSSAHVTCVIDDSIRPLCDALLLELPKMDLVETLPRKEISDKAIGEMLWIYRWLSKVIYPALVHIHTYHPDQMDLDAWDHFVQLYQEINGFIEFIDSPAYKYHTQKNDVRNSMVSTLIDNMVLKGVISHDLASATGIVGTDRAGAKEETDDGSSDSDVGPAMRLQHAT